MSKRKLASLGVDEFPDSRARQTRKRISTTIPARPDSDDCEIISVSLRTEESRRHLNVNPDSNHDPCIDCAPSYLPADAASRQKATIDKLSHQDNSECRTAKAHASPQSESHKVNNPCQGDYENENRAGGKAEPTMKFRSEAKEPRPDDNILSTCPDQQKPEKSNCTLSTNVQNESTPSGNRIVERSSIEYVRDVGPVNSPEVPLTPHSDVQHNPHNLWGFQNYPWGDPRFISLVNMNLQFMNAFPAPPRVDENALTPNNHINTTMKLSHANGSSLNTNTQQRSTQKSRDYVSEFHRLRQLGTVQDISFKFSGENTDWTCEVQCTGNVKELPGGATFSASAKGTSQKKAKHLASKIILEKISNGNFS